MHLMHLREIAFKAANASFGLAVVPPRVLPLELLLDKTVQRPMLLWSSNITKRRPDLWPLHKLCLHMMRHCVQLLSKP